MRLFYEDDREAIRTAIADSGKTVKDVAAHLWPHLKHETRYAKLKTCLDSGGDEELKFSQVMSLMHFCNRFDPIYYACDDTLHARPDRKAPDDQKARLVSAIQDAVHTIKDATRLLENLEQRERSA